MKPKKIIWAAVILLSSLPLLSQNIDKLVITGNKKVSRDTFLFYMKSREGDIYSDSRLKADFLTLWNTGFFEEIHIDAEDSANGKTVTITVKENPLVSSVTYKVKHIKQEDITDKLQEKNISILPFSYYNQAKVIRMQKAIEAFLVEKGYNQGKVNIEEKDDRGQIALTIQVDSGPKTKIGKIVFPGLVGHKVSRLFLRLGMKNNRAHGLFSAIMSKDIYNSEKINEDLEEIRLRLQQKGYLEAKVGTPELTWMKRVDIGGKLQKMIKLSIPIEMGSRYRVGKITISGNKIIKTKKLQRLITLKKKHIYNMKKRNRCIEDISKAYGGLGYFYCQVIPNENLDPEKKSADLNITIQENEIAYVGKLEFSGNTYTKDHVIRREWLLHEGKILNVNALEDSLRRMKQLGLVTIEKMPDIKPDPEDPQKININAEVKEVQRQMVNFNVGYSGYDGLFAAIGYSTQNFMGMGESFSINLQSGTRSKNYQFGFQEPYLFNLPANFGFDIFKTSLRYPEWYTRDGEGFNITSSARVWKFWGASLTYGYEFVNIKDVNSKFETTNPYWFAYFQQPKRKISSISPVLYFSTVDSPLYPTSGTRYLASYRYSGGILGGDIFLHKWKFEFVKFIPMASKHIFGFHAVYEWLKPFGGKDIPPYERYFLGGERSIRGFEIYQVGPKNSKGWVIGGDKSFFLNAEYNIPLNQQLSFVFFYDIGNAYDVGKHISFKDVYSSAGLELKIYIPMLNMPFRLIMAYNPRTLKKEDSHFAFRFAVGPSFY